MINAASFEASNPGRYARISSGGQPSWITNFIGKGSEGAGDRKNFMPQAFLVELSPGGVSRPHFHTEDQFQVVVAGSGSFGRHAIAPVGVHYANAHTGYGPIVGGEQGITFFTLRQIANISLYYLDQPESRAALDETVPKRQLTVQAPDLGQSTLKDVVAPRVEEMIRPHDDGLAAWMAYVPPRGQVTFPRHAKGTGRNYIVIAGSLMHAGQSWGRHSVLFATPDEADVAMVAGEEGLQLLALQYPAMQ